MDYCVAASQVDRHILTETETDRWMDGQMNW